MTVPNVTCVIPTLNSSRTLAECLASISAQEYAATIEVLLVDAGSTDETLAVARRYGVDRVLSNPGQTGETGKAIGARAARGSILAFIDSDNVLVGRDWMTRMTVPFADPKIVSSEPLRWEYSPRYGIIDRYCALTGVNDPVSLFVGNYGRYSHLTGKWTGFAVDEERVAGYLRVRVSPDLLPTMGANGYLVRAEALRSVVTGDHLFDIDLVGMLARTGHDVVARVDIPIGHRFAETYTDFARKTRRRARDYLYYSRRGARTYPWKRYRRRMVLFIVATVTTIPLFVQALVGYMRKRDRAWWFHPIACWTTLAIYAWETVRAFVKTERLARRDWRQ